MGAERDFFRAEAGGKAPPLRVTENVIVIVRGDEGIAPTKGFGEIVVLGIITPVCIPALHGS